MGGIMGADGSNISLLRKMEENIYGSTERKSGVKVISALLTPPEKLEAEKTTFASYLWFSVKLQGRESYPPGTKFSVTFIAQNDEILNVVLGSFWALIYLGGLGSRMRRGAGSLRVTKSPGNLPYNFVFSGTTVNEAREFMENNLKKIFENFTDYYNKNKINEKNPNAGLSNHNVMPNYAVLSKQYASIGLIDKKGDWSYLLKDIDSIYKNFRRSKNIDERAVLGLPIRNSKYRNLGNLRQASPLIFGIMDLNGGYAVRIVKFKTSIHKDYISKQILLEKTLDEFIKDKNMIKEVNIPV